MKVFYDKYIILTDLEAEVKGLGLDADQRQEIEELVDELIHHRVIDRLLTSLPRHHHAEFLDLFHKAPYDEGLIGYLNERIEASVEKHVKEEIAKLKEEILEDIRTKKPS